MVHSRESLNLSSKVLRYFSDKNTPVRPARYFIFTWLFTFTDCIVVQKIYWNNIVEDKIGSLDYYQVQRRTQVVLTLAHDTTCFYNKTALKPNKISKTGQALFRPLSDAPMYMQACSVIPIKMPIKHCHPYGAQVRLRVARMGDTTEYQ